MFANMRGFTQMAQTLNSPENTQNRLNEFLTMLAEEVIKHNGIVNKFLGDGLMAIFRNGNHSRCAFLTAFGSRHSELWVKSTFDFYQNLKTETLKKDIQ